MIIVVNIECISFFQTKYKIIYIVKATIIKLSSALKCRLKCYKYPYIISILWKWEVMVWLWVGLFRTILDRPTWGQIWINNLFQVLKYIFAKWKYYRHLFENAWENWNPNILFQPCSTKYSFWALITCRESMCCNIHIYDSLILSCFCCIDFKNITKCYDFDVNFTSVHDITVSNSFVSFWLMMIELYIIKSLHFKYVQKRKKSKSKQRLWFSLRLVCEHIL